MLDGDEAQRAGAALLDRHIGDAREPLDRLADAQLMVEGKVAAGPHPPRQRHRRQEPAAGRMPILAKPGGRRGRRRKTEVDEPRRGLAPGRCGGKIEGRAEPVDQIGRHLGMRHLFAPDPRPQMRQIDFRLRLLHQ